MPINPSDEVKAKLDIVEVIREYIQLKAAGINFRALCPFHHEKSPSFMVNPEKQIWHCFGCGKGGDAFSFLMEIEGIAFPEALRILARKAGVALKNFDHTLDSKKNRLLDINLLAAKFFHHQLLKSQQAESIRFYLAKRGLTAETIEEWQIGYSLDSWDFLSRWLIDKGFNENEIFMSGLTIKREGRSGFYDRFRGRIMFPLRDINCDTVGFSARVDPAKEATEKLGKYINTPQTMIYDKSKILFGMDRAKQPIKRADLAVLVEGQMDAITAHQNGFTNTIASSGTALTIDQVNLIKRYSQKIALAFDMDEAGLLAAERGIDVALGAEMDIRVIEIGGFKDPDECIRQKPANWRLAIEQAKPMMQYYFDKTLIGLDLSKAAERRQMAKKLLPIVAKLGNKIEKSYWLKKLSQAIEIEERILYEALQNVKQKNYSRKNDISSIRTPEVKITTREEALSESLLSLGIKFPSFWEDIFNRILPEHLAGEEIRAIYNSLIIYYNYLIEKSSNQDGVTEIVFDYQNLRIWLEEASQEHKTVNQPQVLDRLVLLGDKDYFEFEAEQAQQEIRKISNQLKKNFLNNRLKEITRLITQAESEANALRQTNKQTIEVGANLNQLMEELKRVVIEIRELEN